MSKPKTPQAPTRAKLFAEFHELDRLMKLYKPQIDRHKVVKALILEMGDAPEFPADAPIPLNAGGFEVLLSPRKLKSWITSKAALYRRMGRDEFIEQASITLEAVRENGHADLIETERTGNREVVSVAAYDAA